MSKFDPEYYTVLDTKIYVPPTFGRPVENASDALESAACLLEEEGRWRKSSWYEHDNPTLDEYKDDPYCNGWASCAEGALMIVTGGMMKYCVTDEFVAKREREGHPYASTDPQWEVALMAGALEDQRDPAKVAIYNEAYKYLLREVNIRGAEYFGREYDPEFPHPFYEMVYSYNDAAGVTRNDVVMALRQAARAARGEERIDETPVSVPGSEDA